MSKEPSRRALTHARILDVASRALRRNGCAGVGVADVMQQSGLTHGGFYAHFPSRDALLSEALVQAGQDGKAFIESLIAQRRSAGESALRSLIEAYLSERHFQEVGGGCVVAALSSEARHQSLDLRTSFADRVRRLIDIVERALPAGVATEEAMVITSTLVGCIQLAGALGDLKQSRALLAATRRSLLSRYESA